MTDPAAPDAPVRLFVPGRPQPEGSTKAIPFLVDCTVCRPGQPCGNRRICAGGRRAMANVLHDNDRELRAWRDAIAAAARPHFPRPISGPVDVVMVFAFVRPQGHRGARGNLLEAGRARPRPTVKPDGDKLSRAVLDALTGVAYLDDAQVAHGPPDKVYAHADGLFLEIRPSRGLSAEARALLAALGAEEGADGDVWPIGRGGGQVTLPVT